MVAESVFSRYAFSLNDCCLVYILNTIACSLSGPICLIDIKVIMRSAICATVVVGPGQYTGGIMLLTDR